MFSKAIKNKSLAVLLAVCLTCLSVFVYGGTKTSAASYSTAYPNTHVNTGNQIEDLIGVAMTQVGYYGTEGSNGTGTKYGAWYGGNMTKQPWCGMFVSWCANQAGIDTSIILKSARAVAYAYSGEYHYKNGYTPKRGDLVLYNPTSGGYYFPEKDANGRYSRASHVAIVCSYDAASGKIWVVHGNATDSKVCYNSISVSKTAIQAFVTPPYKTGQSAPVDTDYVNDSYVNVRKEPSTSSEKIGMVTAKGTPVNVLETVTDADGDKWYKVQIPSLNITGYIFGEFVTLKPETKPEKPKDTVNGTGVRVRDGASTIGTNILTTVTTGQVVTLHEVAYDENDDKWYKVSFVKDGVNYEGYIFGIYINVVNEPQEDPLSRANYVCGNSVRIRDAASLNSGVLTYVNYGQVVEIINTAYDETEYKWYNVKLEKDGKTINGYIAAEFVTVNKAPKAEISAELTDPQTNLTFNKNQRVVLKGWVQSNLGKAGCYYTLNGGKKIMLSVNERDFYGEIDLSTLNDGEYKVEVFATAGTTEKSIGVRNFVVTNNIAVEFNGMGGINVPETLKNENGETQFKLPFNMPSKENCYFKGWATNQNATVAEYGIGGTYTFKNSVTLYAVWGNKEELVGGDVNCDGRLDAIDLALLKKCVSSIEIPINCNVDINGDGNFDIEDLAILKKLVAGI